MRCMSMLILGIVPILRPLLQLPMLADLKWAQSPQGFLEPCPKRLILVENVGRFNTVGEEIPDDRHVHRACHAHGSMLPVGGRELVLGRGRRRRNQVTLLIL